MQVKVSAVSGSSRIHPKEYNLTRGFLKNEIASWFRIDRERRGGEKEAVELLRKSPRVVLWMLSDARKDADLVCPEATSAIPPAVVNLLIVVGITPTHVIVHDPLGEAGPAAIGRD